MREGMLIGRCNYTYSTVFLYKNEDDTITYIGSVHENDGDWRSEYFNPIFAGIGINIQNVSNLDEVLEEYSEKLENEEIHISKINFTELRSRINIK